MKSIIVYSGGLDSTVLLYRLLQDGHTLRALSVNYGQRHVKELADAKRICTRLGVEQFILELSSLLPLLGGNSQTDAAVPVPHGHYTQELMKQTIVPNRNMIMLSCAIAWAVSTKSEQVAYAAHNGDHCIYPDCRNEFANAVNTAASLCDWHPVSVVCPFVKMTKAQIVSMGHDLQVPFEDTWSCYEGGVLHCGKCGTCVERKEAFQLAKIHDPTEYV